MELYASETALKKIETEFLQALTELSLDSEAVLKLTELISDFQAIPEGDTQDNRIAFEDLLIELADLISSDKLEAIGLDNEDIFNSLFALGTKLTIAGSPGSDSYQTGANGISLILAREGNDVLLAVNDFQELPGRGEFDVLDGGTGGGDQDRFIFGNRTRVFYNSGNPNSTGDLDFGLLLNFQPENDVIQLHGSPGDYLLETEDSTTRIFLKGNEGEQNELIGYIAGVTGLNLNESYFRYLSGEAPPPVEEQIQQFGNVGQNIPINIAVANDDSRQQIYVAGSTVGGLGGVSAGSLDGFLIKYNPIGIRLWSRQIGTSAIDNGYGVNTDSNGNVYWVGRTEGDLAGLNAGIGNDIVLGKYDSDGNLQWIQQFGSFALDNSFVNPQFDAQGNVFVAGYTSSGLFSDDEVTAFPPDFNGWVGKFDQNGNRIWGIEVGASDPESQEELFGLDVDQQGNSYVAGWTLGDFAGPNAGGYDVWIQKIDPNGNKLWSDQIGTSDFDWVWDLKTNSLGETYITGWTLGNLGGINAGSYDYYIAKYSSDGTQQWIKQYGTAGDDGATRIAFDADDNLYLTGYTNAAPPTDVIGTGGDYDAWVSKFTPEGIPIWSKTIGTTELDKAFGLAVQDNRLYVGGYTEGSLGEVNKGSFDGWISQLSTINGSLLPFGGF